MYSYRKHSQLSLLAIGVCLFGILAPGRAEDSRRPTGTVLTLKGHTDMVYSVGFSPDGKQILTGSFDRSLKLWDAASAKLLKTYSGPSGHQNSILTVGYSPNGRYFASGALDNQVKVWENPLAPAQRDYAHSGEVSGLALSPDGTRLAGAGRDGKIRIWNTVDGKQLFELAGHTGQITGVSFSGHGQILASSGSDKTLRLWNATNGQPMGNIGAHERPATGVTLLGNGHAACTADEEGLVKLWQLPITPSRPVAANNDSIRAMVLSADGRTTVTASADKLVRLFNYDNGQQLKQFAAPGDPVSVAISPNNATVALGAADGKVFLWNQADGKLISQKQALPGRVAAIAFHPNSSQFAAAGAGDAVKIWNVLPPAAKPQDKKPPEEKPVATLPGHAGGASSVSFHNSGTQLLTGGADKLVRLWNLADGKVLRSFGPFADPVTSVAFTSDYARVIAAAGKEIRIWTFADAKEEARLVQPANVTSVAPSNDRTKLVAGGADQVIRVWDLQTKKMGQFFQHAVPLHSVGFHPANNAVIGCGVEKTAMVHSLNLTRVLPASAAAVRSLNLTPSGGHVLVCGDDKVTRLLNLGNGVMERAYPPMEGVALASTASRNNVLVAVGGADKVVRLFGLADGKPVATLPVPAPVQFLNFSPNNQLLAAACADNSVVTWNVTYNPGQPLPPEFGQPGQVFAHQQKATAAVFAPDGQSIYSGGLDKTLKHWKIASDQPFRNFGLPNFVDAVAFSPDSNLLATACHDGSVRIFDVVKNQQVREIKAHTVANQTFVYGVAWSPDGKQLVSCSFDWSMKLWDANSGGLIREFKAYKEKAFEQGHRDAIFTVAFSPDGKLLASGSSDQVIKIWNVATGTVVRDFTNTTLAATAQGAAPTTPKPSHPGWVHGLRFTPDGLHIVSTGNAPLHQGYWAIWSVADGRLVYGEQLPPRPFHCIAVSPTGKHIALGCGSLGLEDAEIPCHIVALPGK